MYKYYKKSRHEGQSLHAERACAWLVQSQHAVAVRVCGASQPALRLLRTTAGAMTDLNDGLTWQSSLAGAKDGGQELTDWSLRECPGVIPDKK